MRVHDVWLARGHEGMREPTVGATADGRRTGEYFSANLAPASTATVRSTDALRKVAMFVHAFAKLGCQQLQLDSISVETLRDAQKHPERHANLMVRVWGWSGYFCELAAPYQEHIIARHTFQMQ